MKNLIFEFSRPPRFRRSISILISRYLFLSLLAWLFFRFRCGWMLCYQWFFCFVLFWDLLNLVSGFDYLGGFVTWVVVKTVNFGDLSRVLNLGMWVFFIFAILIVGGWMLKLFNLFNLNGWLFGTKTVSVCWLGSCQ